MTKGSSAPPRAAETDAVAALHADVERRAGRLHLLHAARLQCRRGCSACCVDELTVFEVEAARIRRHHAALLATGAPGPVGGCAFLDADGACRIYADRPYVCRTQGLPLRWLDERDGETVELRDVCPLNEAGPPIEQLAADDCWTLGPSEARLAELQRASGRALRRVRLRDLFAAQARASDGDGDVDGADGRGHAPDGSPSSSLVQQPQPRKVDLMGDKSPKAKDKSKKQHTADKNQKAATAADKAKPPAASAGKKK